MGIALGMDQLTQFNVLGFEDVMTWGWAKGKVNSQSPDETFCDLDDDGDGDPGEVRLDDMCNGGRAWVGLGIVALGCICLNVFCQMCCTKSMDCPLSLFGFICTTGAVSIYAYLALDQALDCSDINSSLGSCEAGKSLYVMAAAAAAQFIELCLA